MGHVRSDIRRSEAVLERLQTSTGLTEQGKEWLIAAFDPFHDRDLDVQGYPDQVNANSLCQCLTLTAQISCPATITTGTWDCHIVDWPFLGPAGAKPNCTSWTPGAASGSVCPGVFLQGSTTILSGSFGGLGVYTYPTGAANTNVFSGTNSSQLNLTPAISDLNTPYRVIGKGFEVYNTTPDLYKSGAVVVYSQPVSDFNSASTAVLSQNSTVSINGSAAVNLMDAPPQNPTEALRLPNSRQWDAREGCYVISKINNCEIKRHLGNWTQPMYYENGPTDALMYGPAFGVVVPTGGQTSQYMSLTDQNWTNFDQDGAYFSGLSIQSTLTINYRLFVEVFPSSSNALANYAHPSPRYDDVALKLYDELIYRAPVGVEVKFNGLGDWFMDGIKAVADVAAPIMTMMPHPGLKAAGIGMQLAKGASAEQIQNNQKVLKQLQASAGTKKQAKKAGKQLAGLDLPKLAKSGKEKKKRK